MSDLNASRVDTIFRDCLFSEEEDKADYVEAIGILATVHFHPGRLASYEKEIKLLLSELPDSFQEKLGGGMSFLNACMDRYDHQWTGLHATMEQLFLLGMATKMVCCPLPRDLWPALPGGMPYYTVVSSVRGTCTACGNPIALEECYRGYCDDCWHGKTDGYDRSQNGCTS